MHTCVSHMLKDLYAFVDSELLTEQMYRTVLVLEVVIKNSLQSKFQSSV